MQASNIQWRVEQLPVPQIRQRIDEVHRFLVERFLPEVQREDDGDVDYAELSRLTGKLEALGERLMYSYFGPDQLRSLQRVLDDLHAIVDLHLGCDLDIDPAFGMPAVTAPQIEKDAAGVRAY